MIFAGVVHTLCGMATLNERVRRDYRLTKDALRLMDAIAKKMGIGRTHVIELAVRQLAEAKGLK